MEPFALESHECTWCLLFDGRQYSCHFLIFLGSFLYRRPKPPSGNRSIYKSTRERVDSKEDLEEEIEAPSDRLLTAPNAICWSHSTCNFVHFAAYVCVDIFLLLNIIVTRGPPRTSLVVS